MKILVFLIFVRLIKGGCSPICTGNKVCKNNVCLEANTESDSSCTQNSDCADQNKGYCSAGKCYCNNKRMFSWYYLKCLYKTGYSDGQCSSINGCTDQSSRGRCNNDRCECKSSYTASEVNGKCGAGFNSGCSSDNDCADNMYGECRSGICACKDGYGWNNAIGICRPYNDGQTICNADIECYDTSSRAYCNGTCTCVSEAVYDSSTHSCLYENDGTHSCSDISYCLDQVAVRAECDSTCKCKENYVFSSSDKQCIGYNNGGTFCSSIDNCFDRTEYMAQCLSSACTCIFPCTYDETSHLCLAPNNNTVACSSITHCRDQNIATTICSTNCKCLTNYFWSKIHEKCLLANDNTHLCSDISDCCDQTIVGVCSTYCTCEPTNVWIEEEERCGCEAGMFEETIGGGNCSTCPSGKYQDNKGQTECIPCEAGSYQNLTGQTSCVKCPMGKNVSYEGAVSEDECLPCPKGQFNNVTGAAVCIDCDRGSFASTTGMIECELCSRGTHQAFTGKDSCNNCIAGRYQPKTGQVYCWPCPVGTFTADTGMTSCQNCSAGTYQNSTQQSSCLNCSVGTYQPDERQIACLSCPAGTHNPEEMKTDISDCLACDIGTYSPSEGYGQCLDCEAGSYNNQTNQSECVVCEEGTYQNLTGQSTCTDCPPGKFQSSSGQTSCLNCSAGTYSYNSKQTVCTNCPALSSSEAGATICICDSNAYYNSSEPINYCFGCHEFCQECEGNKYNCSTCIENDGIIWQNINVSASECHCKTEDGYYIFDNPITQKQECKECHPLCLRCFGGTLHECEECKPNISYTNELVGSTCNCIDGYFFDSTQNSSENYCQKCHEFCTLCEGTKYTCSQCIDNYGIRLSGTSCGCSVAKYFVYYNTSTLLEECVKCHPLCTNCDGPFQTQCSSCDSTLGAVFESPNTCVCSAHHYYDENTIQCEVCNPMCKNCFGGTSSKCYNCDTSVSYAVEDVNYLCVGDCELYGSYYTSVDICKHCDDECEKCWAGASNNCNLCADISKQMLNGSCLSGCPTHYFAQDRLCYPCHTSCLNCTNSTRRSCTSCYSPLLFYQSQCLETCPNKTYESNGICLDCVSPCETCTSQVHCQTCASGYYKISGTTSCVAGEYCPSGTYAEDKTRICENCYFTCLTCAGGTSSDCKICNYALAYSKSSNEIGECFLLICLEGMYVYIDTSLQKAYCRDCHQSCVTCDGGGAEYCITCNANYESFDSPVANHQICKSCAEINSGYIIKAGGGCEEICGDGKNYGEFECDDGNKINGDGCSSNCVIEAGFECSHEYEEADVCVDVLAPSAKLSIKKTNKLIVTFSEKVQSIVDSSSLQNSMKITLDGASSSCNFNWSLSDTFSASKIFLKLNITTVVECSLKGSIEKFIVKFINTTHITDPAGNILSTSEISAEAQRFVYISKSEKEAVEGSGSAFSSSSVVTFGLAIGMIAFQSVAINSFWAFVNVLQMISYLPMINVVLPSNMELFLTKYMTMKKLTFPFYLLPDWVPNPISWMSDFITSPLNANFELCGYESLSFLYNFADELFTWFLLFIFYIVLRILTWCISRESFETIHRWREEYEYNGIFRVLLECFLNMNFCACLSIWMLDISSTLNILSIFGASVALYLSIGFMIKCMKLVEVSEEELLKEDFKQQFGTLTEDLKTNTLFGRQFYPIFMFRRLLYTIILVVLVSYPLLQLYLTIFAIILPMLVYLIICRPYSVISQNIMNIYNECVLLFAFLWALIQNSIDFSDVETSYLGWTVIILILFSLLATWILMIPGIIKEISNMLCKSNDSSPSLEGTSDILEPNKSQNETIKSRVNLDQNTLGKEKKEKATSKEHLNNHDLTFDPSSPTNAHKRRVWRKI